MKITKDSHCDHGLTEAQKTYLLEKFAAKAEFFIETVELPVDLGTVPCGLYGPSMGDQLTEVHSMVCDYHGSINCPCMVGKWVVFEEKRGTREYYSRMTIKPPRPTRLVTVIAGPHEGEPCVMYTAFGGPLTPQEPGDPSCKDVGASKQFWAQHALSRA